MFAAKALPPQVCARVRQALGRPALVMVVAALAVPAANSQHRRYGTFRISGVVTGAGATLKLSGSTSAGVTAASDGTFAFSNLKNGTYVVTPSEAGYEFSPISRSVSVNNANVTGINFTGAATATSSISGTVSGASATVTLSGTSAASATVADGATFTFAGLTNGTYAVTPTQSGYSFSPAAASVTINGTNVTGVNFTGATRTAFSISGTVSGAAATVTLSGASATSATVAAGGTFTFGGLINGLYVVSASESGYAFSPSTAPVTVSGANVAGVNFTGAAVPPSVSLSWTASTSPSISGYNLYRGSTTGGPYATINSSLIAGTSYVDTAVTPGATYYYVSTAVNSSSMESVYSNQASAVVP